VTALADLYRDLHRNPELSFAETRTAGIGAAWLREAGFETTEGVGGTGVVGVLRNGPGPTALLRADMDALPVAEATGLPYASRVGAPGRVSVRNRRPVQSSVPSSLARLAWCGARQAMSIPSLTIIRFSHARPMSRPADRRRGVRRAGTRHSLTGIRVRTRGTNTARRDPVTGFLTGRSSPAETPPASVINGQKSHALRSVKQ